MTAKTAAERDRARRARLKAEGKTARIVWVYPAVVDSLKAWVRKANAKEERSSRLGRVGHIEDESK